jgi:hypothetical protein
MRELAGKGCLCLISLIFGVFIGTRFYWIAGVPHWAANLISLISAAAIAWFFIGSGESKK